MKLVGYDTNVVPWVGRYDGSGPFNATKLYSDWTFYDDSNITACSAYAKECSTGEGKLLRENITKL